MLVQFRYKLSCLHTYLCIFLNFINRKHRNDHSNVDSRTKENKQKSKIWHMHGNRLNINMCGTSWMEMAKSIVVRNVHAIRQSLSWNTNITYIIFFVYLGVIDCCLLGNSFIHIRSSIWPETEVMNAMNRVWIKLLKMLNYLVINLTDWPMIEYYQSAALQKSDLRNGRKNLLNITVWLWTML